MTYCTNGFFGGDPLPGVGKACFCESTDDSDKYRDQTSFENDK
jgi:hypothetical protein